MAKSLSRLLNEFDFFDQWRSSYPERQDYTFFSRVHYSYSHIDMVWGNATALEKVEKIEIRDNTWSDHSINIWTMKDQWNTIKKATWRLKDYLLHNKTILDSLRSQIVCYFEINMPNETSYPNNWCSFKVTMRDNLISLEAHSNRNKSLDLISLYNNLAEKVKKNKTNPSRDNLKAIKMIKDQINQINIEKNAKILGNRLPVEVAVTLEVASINAVSEENMDYTATIFLLQRWTDERLKFEGNKSITLDARLVQLLWVPDTYIVDSKKSFLHDVTVQNRLVRLFSNGTVLYALRITTTVACNMDLAKYPMDKQTCTLQIESLGYSNKDLIYTWMRGNDSVRGMNTLKLAQYTVQNYYTKVSMGHDETGQYTRLVLYFVLQRNMIYFILETYVPSTLLVILSWISFWISMSSVPARTCFGVTTVLAMTTILMGSRSTLPTANCFIKAIDVYLGICFTFVFGALLEYAVAHYCSEEEKTSIKDSRQHPEEKPDDNIEIVIKSTSKELSLTENQENTLMQKNSESSYVKTVNISQTFWMKIKEKKDFFKDFFTVKNPENIDRYSRVVFPLVFLIINVFYWAYYLHMS
ncbi:gamma-aminobutyric acid receptor subunit pi [Pelobates cultripes]|uniref:Gamma-aminobutyric acid receptor subunit pi n=1 Tax=Pelobates cultripes TaxID=61616 RepID=A0AAD1VYK4_PELCU|nr:gamma-aminobutyric acid receptor subunit pi [Pelobates cultripes]